MTQIRKILAGDVLHMFKDFDHANLAYILGINHTVPEVLKRIKILQKQDPQAMEMLKKQFNAKDEKGLAGEVIEYYQNHPDKFVRWKRLMETDPRNFGKDKTKK